MFSWFNRKRVPREFRMVVIPHLGDDHVSVWLQDHPPPDREAQGIEPGWGDLLSMRSEAPYLHLASSTVLPELRQFGVVTGVRLPEGRKPLRRDGERVNPYDGQRDTITIGAQFDADTSPFFVATDSIDKTWGWFAEMNAESTQADADFPIVLAMASNYPMYRSNGLTHVSKLSITKDNISTIFAPAGRVDEARLILGDGSKLNVRSWPRATRDARAVGRVEEGAGLALGL